MSPQMTVNRVVALFLQAGILPAAHLALHATNMMSTKATAELAYLQFN